MNNGPIILTSTTHVNIVNHKGIFSLSIIILRETKGYNISNMTLMLTYFYTGQYHYRDVSSEIQKDKYEQYRVKTTIGSWPDQTDSSGDKHEWLRRGD